MTTNTPKPKPEEPKDDLEAFPESAELFSELEEQYIRWSRKQWWCNGIPNRCSDPLYALEQYYLHTSGGALNLIMQGLKTSSQ